MGEWLLREENEFIKGVKRHYEKDGLEVLKSIRLRVGNHPEGVDWDQRALEMNQIMRNI